MRAVVAALALAGCLSAPVADESARQESWADSWQELWAPMATACVVQSVNWYDPALYPAMAGFPPEPLPHGSPLHGTGLEAAWRGARLVSVEWKDPVTEGRAWGGPGHRPPTLYFLEDSVQWSATYLHAVPMQDVREDVASMLQEVLGHLPAQAYEAAHRLERPPDRTSALGGASVDFFRVEARAGDPRAFVERIHGEGPETHRSVYHGLAGVVLETAHWKAEVETPVVRFEAQEGLVIRAASNGGVEVVRAGDELVSHAVVAQAGITALHGLGLPVPQIWNEGFVGQKSRDDCPEPGRPA